MIKQYVFAACTIIGLSTLTGCFWPFNRKKSVEQKKITHVEEVSTQSAAVAKN